MTEWIQHIEFGIRELARVVPLEVFVVFGSFIEEIIAPIPSMLVMTTAGFIAAFDGRTTFFIVWLVLLGNLGKLAGSFIYYTIGDKLEDVVIGRYGNYFGLKHADIERIGQKFNGSPWRDGALIFFVRVIPFFPTILVSIAAGVVRIRRKVFLTASYLGNFCKDLFYAFTGYYGVRALRAFFMDVERVRFGINVIMALAVIGLLVFLYIHRQHGLRLYQRFIVWLKKVNP
ncbi:MAG: DedA family protein [Undibacterium sp.]